MENTITTTEQIKVNDKIIDDFLFGSNTKLSAEQIALFKNVAISSNLNPFKREIYAVPYEKSVKVGNSWIKEPSLTIITGYQVYISRATQTGLLDGWSVEVIEKNNKLAGARITIHRKDMRLPFIRDVSIDEFAKKNADGSYQSMWKTMPEFMIKKIAIGQGFRLAFPNELGGLPYLEEEMGESSQKGGDVIQGETVSASTAKVPPTKKEPVKKPKNKDKFDEIIEEMNEEKDKEEKLRASSRDKITFNDYIERYAIKIQHCDKLSLLQEKTKEFFTENALEKGNPIRDRIMEEYQTYKTAFNS